MNKYKPGSFGALSKSEITETVLGDIHANNKGLTSLEGSPESILGNFDISRNSKLKSLLGGPKEIDGHYIVDSCGITSLEGIPSRIGSDLVLANNPLTSLRGINKLRELNGWVFIDDCPITSHILGVFLIKGCSRLHTYDHASVLDHATKVVNRHISKGRAGLLPCQKELIEAGFYEFAKI
jgi:hypothetical protein